MDRRQVWNYVSPSKATTSSKKHCTPFTLPSNGVLTIGPSSVITLTSDAVFRPECTASSDIILANADSPSTVEGFRDPFYASTLPECYALAATSVIAYMLVIMLLITPRTFLREGSVVLGRRGFTNGPSGTDNGIGIGGRPWLQKVAAMTVAISLSIATADTFRVAEIQYNAGYMDAGALQNEVENGTELKVIRVISDTFLWLAQAQTLIRLFPRQREKIIIKWTAFALISLDSLFSCLNNFVYNANSRPRSFVDAVPALSYLFQLALSLLYSAWVIYYSLTKKRFAFYHPEMRNICLVAALSLLSVLVPVVFFVLDISKPNLAGWGDYVRWVGAAAASVVVWEWVERIEALEREDKKDGVLGREVFDGDEMLEVTPSSDFTRSRRRQNRKDDGSGGDGTTTSPNGGLTWPGMAGIASRYMPRAAQDVESNVRELDGANRQPGKQVVRPRPPLWPTRPPPATTPVSRTDTASAESTLYAIRYHPISEATPPIIKENGVPPTVSRTNSLEVTRARSTERDGAEEPDKRTDVNSKAEFQVNLAAEQARKPWLAISNVNPFHKKVQKPPPEVSAHTIAQEPANGHIGSNRWDFRGRLEEFAAAQADKIRDKNRQTENVDILPLTVIPAPPRRRHLTRALEELENAEAGQRTRNSVAADLVANTAENRPHGSDEADGSRHLQPPRLNDPYTPNKLNPTSITHRGSISFVTSIQRSRQTGEGSSNPAADEHGGSATVNSWSSTAQSQSSTLSRRDGLPVTSIPAPPRRHRVEQA